MDPLILEGETLGKRHQHFNKLVNEAISHKLPFESIRSLEEKSDIDRLFKIDLAANCRDVEYILETLRSEDMLYVSRAIKQTPWLITDTQYAHIVNPLYLNDHLFPLMTSKAKCKFLLQVRLHLKQESRVEEFFKYYEDKDRNIALKWLPVCAQQVIDKAVEKYGDLIDDYMFKRLCQKSFTVLENFVKKSDRFYLILQRLKSVMFLMSTNLDRFLDILETSFVNSHAPKLGAKYTDLIMKRKPERILMKFEKYAYCIDVATFVKYLGKTNIEDFLLKQRENENLQRWFTYDNIKPYLVLMPKEGKFEFIKMIFIDKKEQKTHRNRAQMAGSGFGFPVGKRKLMKRSSAPQRSYSSNIYQCYRHAPADVALPELKKMIRTESSPDERIAMMAVMLSCARINMNNVQAVLQYYHDRHINEPFKYKVQFINNVISTTNTHRYNQTCWKILDELFHSMDVYIESDNNVQNCVEAVILYKLVHDEPIPEIIEKKFKFTTFQKKICKLNDKEKQTLFNYLYTSLKKKITEQEINNQGEFSSTASSMNQMIDLLVIWKKDIVDYPYVLNLMKVLAKLKKEKSWTDSLMINSFYKNKSWRKHLFEESLVLLPSQEVCMNALKHDPQLLKRYSAEVDTVRFSDNVSLTQFLNKLKIYWTGAESLADEWIAAYRARLQQPGGHKAVTRALTTLLTAQQLLDLIKQYAPVNTKIVWSEADELQLSLQKQIAMNMHIARPQPSPDAVLLYAKGDYLQYALPSLTAIFYNMSSARSRNHIPKLIDAPVSIQKHGIRQAFMKLNFEEMKNVLTDVWKATKNASIRAVIFEHTYKLLRQEKRPAKIEQLWKLLEIFIDNLTAEENKSIYNLLGKIDALPKDIQARFCVKSYNFLKGLPAKVDCGDMVRLLAEYTVNLMDTIDPDFIEEILLEHTDNLFNKNIVVSYYGGIDDVVSLYIISADSEELQLQRYETVLKPMMNYSFKRCNELHKDQYAVKRFMIKQLNNFIDKLEKSFFKTNILLSVKLFKTIHDDLQNALTVAENYAFLTLWRMFVAFVECLKKLRFELNFKSFESPVGSHMDCGPDKCDKWDLVCHKIMPTFGKSCLEMLQADVANYYPSIYILFSNSLEKLLNNIRANKMVWYDLFESLLSSKEFIYGYMLVLKLFPMYEYEENAKNRRQEILKIIEDNVSEEVKMHYSMLFYPEF